MFSLGKTKVATAETTTELAQLMASVAWAQALNDETISDSYEQIFTSLIFASKKPRSQRFIEDSKGTQASHWRLEEIEEIVNVYHLTTIVGSGIPKKNSKNEI